MLRRRRRFEELRSAGNLALLAGILGELANIAIAYVNLSQSYQIIFKGKVLKMDNYEEQVFNEEFKNVDYFILPEHALLKCNYTIESTLSKACFKTLCGRSESAA